MLCSQTDIGWDFMLTELRSTNANLRRNFFYEIYDTSTHERTENGLCAQVRLAMASSWGREERSLHETAARTEVGR